MWHRKSGSVMTLNKQRQRLAAGNMA